MAKWWGKNCDALLVQDECKFMAGFGETVAKMHPPGHDIVAFRFVIVHCTSTGYIQVEHRIPMWKASLGNSD